MKLAVIMSPPLRFSAYGRTGACLIHEAHLRGHELWCLTPEDVTEQNDRLIGRGYCIDFTSTADLGTFWRRLQLLVITRPKVAVDLRNVDAILWRKDPPLNRKAAKLLSTLVGDVHCFNDPRALLAWATKSKALKRFGHLMPPSVVVKTMDSLLRTASSIPGSLVIKPVEERGGRGVIRVHSLNRTQLKKKIEEEPLLAGGLTSGAGLVVQQEVRATQAGDVRILCLEGRVLGAMRRIPQARDFRANVSAGARVAPASLSSMALDRWEAVARVLAEEGLAFVGLDVIGRWLIEINVLSPGGIPRLNSLFGLRLQRDVLSCMERRVESRSADKPRGIRESAMREN